MREHTKEMLIYLEKRNMKFGLYIDRFVQKTDGQVDGLVACELSARNYGVGQWWVLLEPCMDTTRPPSAPGRHMCNAAGIRSSCDASLQGVQP